MGRKFRRYERKPKRVKRSPLRQLPNLLLSVVTIVCGVALLLTLMAPYIEPSHWGVLPLMALAAPAIYVINLILTLYWVTQWRWRYAAPIALLLILGARSSNLFVKIPLTKSYNNESYRGMVKVISYNVRNFNDDKGYAVGERVAKYLEGEMADIICLQEYNPTIRNIDSLTAPRLHLFNRVQDEDRIILSKFPIIASSLSEECELKEISVWADIVIRKDTIRVINNHLQSTDIKASDSKYLTTNEIVRDTNRRSTLRDIFWRYSESCVIRAEEARAVARLIEQSPYQVVVCGDFNDTAASYAYSTIAEGLSDAFEVCGEGFSYTFRGFYNTLRIDYILTSEGLTPKSYRVDTEMQLSDHLPVMSHIKIE